MVTVVDGEEEKENSREKKYNKKDDEKFLKQMSPSKWFIQFLLPFLTKEL